MKRGIIQVTEMIVKIIISRIFYLTKRQRNLRFLLQTLN